MAQTVVFDIIGTCFSFDRIRERLAAMDAPKLLFELWFAQTLRDAFALSHSGGYVQLKDVFAAELPRTLRAAGPLSSNKESHRTCFVPSGGNDTDGRAPRLGTGGHLES